MDLGLRGKVALVTGGYRGLGRSICWLLAEEGASVAVNHRHSPDQAGALVEQIRQQFGTPALAVAGDIACEADVARIFDQIEQQLGPVDALVNNAAYCPPSATVDLTLDEFNRALQVNLAGTFLCSREMARRSLTAKRPGKIVNISSQAAFRGS
jgi:3-oxoacyl-[acyl-carrier protein] reductase